MGSGYNPVFRPLKRISFISLFTGTLALCAGAIAIGLSTYQPIIVAGPMLMVASTLVVGIACLTLCCARDSEAGAYNAALLCLVVHIICTVAIVFAASGTAWDFCDESQPCWVLGPLEGLDNLPGRPKCLNYDLGEAGPKDNCIPKLSYQCFKEDPTDYFNGMVKDLTRMANETLINAGDSNATDSNVTSPPPPPPPFLAEYRGLQTCEHTWSQCKDADLFSFWGFDNRADCTSYYEKLKKKFEPAAAQGLVLMGCVVNIFTTTVTLVFAVRASGI
ncbi:hypothetical protein M885DRAFT_529540 [Pelagophyceae sp. CCMP2097]|nr:hypothetical protein M885DRAFT_529540 [Pelagophyceae sp. CCMP2097]|mmetsp:Transcript_135/g.528  ORF Transcript_135/g.528 Transcript_135/m.528 type:complete len:276 (-) Transcript_135:336-1163(-)